MGPSIFVGFVKGGLVYGAVETLGAGAVKPGAMFTLLSVEIPFPVG
jgi:hypothetical protein